MGIRKTPIFFLIFYSLGDREKIFPTVIRLTLTRLSSQVSEAEFEFPQSLYVFADYTQQFYVCGDYTHQFYVFVDFTQR